MAAGNLATYISLITDDKMHTICVNTPAMKVFNWNPEKNRRLIEERGLSFEEAIFYIQAGGLLDDTIHPNERSHPNQRVFIVAIQDYVYLVPYVEDSEQIF